MRVQKRDGTYEEISFDKVLRRIRTLCTGLDSVKSDEIAQKVCARIYDGVSTSELDELAAQMCASLVTTHPDYGTLAGRIIISNHQKKTSPSFSETVSILYNNIDINGKQNPIVSKDFFDIVQQNKEKLNSIIDYDRDFILDYFGFKTLERSYLSRVNGKIVERPQHMWLRVAIGIHGSDIKDAIETYDLMSTRCFTHATPTLFNAGSCKPQMSSCYLIAMKDDSIEGIYDTLKEAALISKWAGGIGLHIHNVRGRNSKIRGTNGISTGIIPMLRNFNETALYVNQAGKRNGSIAIYLEPWHCDIESFLDLRKNHGNEAERCRDLFTAMWIPDLFMERVKANADFSLFCPDECPGLSDVYGAEFSALYEKYESEGKARKVVKAQQIWMAILKSQIETGTPYLCYKDAVNKKTNQQNLGTIKSLNLCVEIAQYSDPNETAVCNLASIGLPTCVDVDDIGNKKFNHERLGQIVQVITKNLNKIIDKNYYPVETACRSNLRHRPIGIGIQGLANVFALLRMPFDSPEAAKVNVEIFETIYYYALTASMNIAKKRSEYIDKFDSKIDERIKSNKGIFLEKTESEDPEFIEICKYLVNWTDEEKKLTSYKGAYTTFNGSPASNGILQFDMWGVTPSDRYNWTELKENIKKYGLRNSLLIAPMPTAGTSQILGFNESFEPITSNIYQRQTLAGEFIIINKHLVKDLLDIGLWNIALKDRILSGNGSIQHIQEIPEEIRNLYKTAWEIKQKVLIDHSADRGAFICQSQSLNLWIEDPEYSKLGNMHFYAWSKGLKTGIYYLRTRTKAKVTAYTLEPQITNVQNNSNLNSNIMNNQSDSDKALAEAKLACSINNREACTMCSS